MMRINKYCLTIAAALTVAAASCKKDYNCDCTLRIYDPYMNTNVTHLTSDKIYGTKNQVVAKCAARRAELDTTDYIYATCVPY